MVLRPSRTTPSTGTCSPGRTLNRSPKRASLQCHVFVAGAPHPARRLGSKRQKRAHGLTGFPASAKFENLTGQNQSDNHRGGFEVKRRQSAVLDQLGRQKRGTKSVANALYKKAAPVPSAIKVNMLKFRPRSERHPRTKKGQPA